MEGGINNNATDGKRDTGNIPTLKAAAGKREHADGLAQNAGREGGRDHKQGSILPARKKCSKGNSASGILRGPGGYLTGRSQVKEKNRGMTFLEVKKYIDIPLKKEGGGVLQLGGGSKGGKKRTVTSTPKSGEKKKRAVTLGGRLRGSAWGRRSTSRYRFKKKKTEAPSWKKRSPRGKKKQESNHAGSTGVGRGRGQETPPPLRGPKGGFRGSKKRTRHGDTPKREYGCGHLHRRKKGAPQTA